MQSSEDRKQRYREAYARWQRDLEHLHRVLLDGEKLDPMHRIALIRSESHSFERYENERSSFLGLGPVDDGSSPFFGQYEAQEKDNA